MTFLLVTANCFAQKTHVADRKTHVVAQKTHVADQKTHVVAQKTHVTDQKTHRVAQKRDYSRNCGECSQGVFTELCLAYNYKYGSGYKIE